MAERDDDNQGEMIDLPDEDSGVEDTDDGGALVTIDESPTPADSEFYANLAETMPSYELQT